MDKTALKSFAIYARNKLMQDVATKANLIGITQTKIEEPVSKDTDFMIFNIGLGKTYKLDKKDVIKRESLIKEIKNREIDSNYKTAFNSIIEEVAYTWFNRMVAVRFMEVNDYLPNRTRVLSSGVENDDIPEIVTNVFDSDLEFTKEEQDYVYNLKEDGSAVATNELFNFLFIKTCNDLNEILPDLFEKSNDYTELLFNISYSDTEGVVYKLIHDISEDDFNVEKGAQVEIFGWMYQYYNSQLKDDVFAKTKGKSKKIEKQDVPAVTQLFTPDWIVKYMVENSLGRLWYEGHNNEELKNSWKYYLDDAKQSEEVEQELKSIKEEYRNIQPEKIKFIDPCMGSGHILIYAFDILMEIYISNGYAEKEAAKLILENNLYGIDIDKRAFQIAYFSLMMKARKHNRRILNGNIKTHLTYIVESNNVNKAVLKYFGKNIAIDDKEKALNEINYLVETFIDAQEYGSLIENKNCDWKLLEDFLNDEVVGEVSLFDNLDFYIAKKILLKLIEQGKVLANKYDVSVTNPPYMGASGMSPKLSKFAIKSYKDSKNDLCTMFVERSNRFIYENRYMAMITMHSWMFLTSYAKLRKRILKEDLINMIHLGIGAFSEINGEVVQTVTWVQRKKTIANNIGRYVKLVDFRGELNKREKYLDGKNSVSCSYLYEVEKQKFNLIPNQTLVYWASNAVMNAFKNGEKMGNFLESKVGLQTGDNNQFLKLWFEVEYSKIFFKANNVEEAQEKVAKWFPHNKGGSRRQWYGNFDYVVNWEKNGCEIKNFYDKNGKLRSRPQNCDFYFKEGITWSEVNTGKFSIRLRPAGSIFDVTGTTAFSEDMELLKYLLALTSTNFANYIFKMLNPTIHLTVSDFSKFPVIENKDIYNRITELATDCIYISKTDWDSFETAWDFNESLMISNVNKIGEAYKSLKIRTNKLFESLSLKEQKINEIFLNIYNFKEEFSEKVEDKDITITRIYDNKSDIPATMKNNNYVITKKDVIKQFISYFVGCMFGRYSLDVEGLVYAGGEFDDSKYKTFIPDPDNCIPITDFEKFDDDIVVRFVEFVKFVYGEDTLEENLEFIAEALEGKEASREVIRNYFIKDFFKDHCKMYKKRPIYWLYDSGKENGFKALVYMHRYNAKTTSFVRTKYLNPLQSFYRNRIEALSSDVEISVSASDKKKAKMSKEKIEKQLKEMKIFDDNIAHIANEEIEIDLDDGVKINYDKVQTDRNGKVLNILAKIK